jgi:sugar transferase (PEP-CTERM/EpsH1 system associated)
MNGPDHPHGRRQAPITQAPLLAHVVYHFGTGGLENGLVNLINRLPRGNFRHAVISLTDHTDFRGRIERPDVAFFDLNKPPGHSLGWMFRLYGLLRELKPDLIHTRNLNAVEAQFVAALAGVPARLHGEHGRDVFDLEGKNWKYNLLRRAARPLVRQYTCVSRDLANWLRDTVGVAPARLRQIYNGVDSEKFHPRVGARPNLGPPGFLAGATCVIGSIGRMVAVKDYPTLARAFIRLCRQTANPAGLRLVIVGDGGARGACQALLEQAGLGAQAWLPGTRDDTADLLRAMDLFVLPSLGEGISNTILEAMASGLPVIASAVGGNPELVAEGANGTLFMPGDDVALAGILLDYAADPERRAREGEATRRRIERDFSLERMAAAYQAVYEAALEPGQ